MMSLSGLRPEGYRVQKGGPKEDRKVPFLARSSGLENRPKKAFFWTLRRKVQGEWGGSAHSPDPTAQSAPQPPGAGATRPRPWQGGVGGRRGGVGGSLGWTRVGLRHGGVGQGHVPGGSGAPLSPAARAAQYPVFWQEPSAQLRCPEERWPTASVWQR